MSVHRGQEGALGMSALDNGRGGENPVKRASKSKQPIRRRTEKVDAEHKGEMGSSKRK